MKLVRLEDHATSFAGDLFTYSGTSIVSSSALAPVIPFRTITKQVQYTGVKRVQDELSRLASQANRRGWDGQDGLPIEATTLHGARRLMACLPAAWESPTLDADALGHIHLEWYRNKRNLLVVVIDEREVLYFISRINGNPSRGTVNDFTDTFPPRLARELRLLGVG